MDKHGLPRALPNEHHNGNYYGRQQDKVDMEKGQVPLVGKICLNFCAKSVHGDGSRWRRGGGECRVVFARHSLTACFICLLALLRTNIKLNYWKWSFVRRLAIAARGQLNDLRSTYITQNDGGICKGNFKWLWVLYSTSFCHTTYLPFVKFKWHQYCWTGDIALYFLLLTIFGICANGKRSERWEFETERIVLFWCPK